jgi:CheY-like chemotaxis protein
MPHATILYAEDDALVRLNVAVLLSDEGWRVETCKDGLSALAQLEGEARYDLLLLDNSLPRLSGLEVTACARRLPHRRDLAIVILSADCSASEARRAGADMFLRKPEDVSRLVAVVCALLDSRRGA